MDNVADFFDGKAKSQARKELPPVPAKVAAEFQSDGRVQIDLGDGHLPTINKACWQAIAQHNEPPLLFSFANNWVRLGIDDKRRPTIKPASPEIVRHHLSQWADWFKDISANRKAPPIENIKDVMATHNAPLPVLRRIVTAPVFSRDGKLNLTPGYDTASQTFYAPADGFAALPVSDEVSDAEASEAVAFIYGELLLDFPFASKADKQNAVALFLLPFARDLINGPTPNHLVEASTRGSGKSLLVNALLYAATGTEVPLLTEQHDDEGWRKAITSHLLAGLAVALIDNINRPVDSGALAAAWTGAAWNDRILGRSELANVTIETIWAMTGNNVTMSAELIRRSIRVRLTPKEEKPETRTGFRHESLLEWVKDNRPKLVWCAHVMIKRWLQHGSPRPEGLRPKGSYENWQRVIGGVLFSLGMTEFLGNDNEFQAASDTDTDTRRGFVLNWLNWASHPGHERDRAQVRVSDLIPVANATEGFHLSEKSERAAQVGLGRWLTRHKDAFISVTEETPSGDVSYRLQIQHGKKDLNGQHWALRRLD